MDEKDLNPPGRIRPIVRVTWKDCHSVDEWVGPEEPKLSELPEIHTVGYLIFRNESFMTVCLNWDPEGLELSCAVVIPQGMILSAEVLSEDSRWSTLRSKARRGRRTNRR